MEIKQIIKKEIIDTISEIYSETNIQETVDLFLDIVDKKNLSEISDALRFRFIDQKFTEFETARTLLASQFEIFFKSLFKLQQRQIQGELKVCLVEFFKDFNFLISGGNSYKFFEKDDVTKEPIYSPDYFHLKMPYGKELKTSYDLRNAITHSGKLYGGVNPNSDNLISDIRSLLIAYIFVTGKYLNNLEAYTSKLFDRTITNYLNQVINDYKKWQKRFVHIEGQEDFSVLDTYAIENKPENNNEKERTGTIDDLRKNQVSEKRMLIWGEAGMGKSTTLQYLAYKDAKSALQNLDKPIPVYLPLKLQTDKNASIEKTIFEIIGVDAKTGFNLLKQGRINLFIDGVNEILKDLRQNKQREIEQILANYPDTFVIITNRPQQFNQFDNIPVFELQKLDDEQIKLFLQKNTQDKEVKKKILSQIKENQSLKMIVATPLMLWMLICVVEERGKIPETKTIIIEEFMHRLYKREAQKNPDFIIDEISSLLRHLGAESYSINDANAAMTRGTLEKILLQRKKEFGFETSISFFIDITTKLNILAKDNKQYSFAHQEYQTYFAGEELEIENLLDNM